MKRILGILTSTAFFAVLCVVGAVEHGANLSMMLWTIPCLAVMAVASKKM